MTKSQSQSQSQSRCRYHRTRSPLDVCRGLAAILKGFIVLGVVLTLCDTLLGQEESPPPYDIELSKGRDVLSLRDESGFRQIRSFPRRPVTYILDPGIHDEHSRSYDVRRQTIHAETSGSKREPLAARPEFASLLKRERAEDGLEIGYLVRDVFRDFLDHACPNAVEQKNLLTLLRGGAYGVDGSQLLLTFAVEFWIEESPEEAIHCRVELRAFRVGIEPLDSKDPALGQFGSLTRCELIFEDASRGTVATKHFRTAPDGSHRAVRAAIVDALRDRLTVNFCLNPRIHADHPVKGATKSDMLGPSISEYEQRG